MTENSKRSRGRPKGARNKKTLQVIRRAEKNGETPLDYMLRVMRDQAVDDKRRDTMAAAAAPFLHARLSNSTVTTTIKRSVDELTTAELLAAIDAEGDAAGAAEAEAGLREPDQLH
jgi:hypothetical protein